MVAQITGGAQCQSPIGRPVTDTGLDDDRTDELTAAGTRVVRA